MSNCRRIQVPGGTYFFTVNLLEQNRRLLVDHVDLLRASFRAAQAARPFEVLASAIMPITCIACGDCRPAMRTTRTAGRRSGPASPGGFLLWSGNPHGVSPDASVASGNDASGNT